jgi:hypothetical protein
LSWSLGWSAKDFLLFLEAQGKKATVAAWERIAMGMGEIFCLLSGVPWGWNVIRSIFRWSHTTCILIYFDRSSWNITRKTCWWIRERHRKT